MAAGFVDPHSGLLRKPPLPRSTGERKCAAATTALLQPGFLSPVERGRGAERSEAEWGSTEPSAMTSAANEDFRQTASEALAASSRASEPSAIALCSEAMAWKR